MGSPEGEQDIEFDEFCNPDEPLKIKYDEIVAAQKRIADGILKTPCVESHMSEKYEMNLYFKQEFLQWTGSFKDRGTLNVLLSLNEQQMKKGVITATTGNHGLSLAHNAKELFIPCIVVLPETAARNKIDRLMKMGAKLMYFGKTFAEAKRHAMGYAKEKKLYYVNGYDHPHVIEGNGTVGLEIVQQVPKVEAVLVPVGGGSLLAGVATAVKRLKPDVLIYGIETENTASMSKAFRRQRPVSIDSEKTLADCLSIPKVGVNTYHTVKTGMIEQMLVLNEDWLTRAVVHLAEQEKFVIEPGGATGLAAIMAGLLPDLKGKTVVSILSGGNVDMMVIVRMLERGLSAEGRLLKFRVTVPDRPGSLAGVATLLGRAGVTIRDCVPEKTWIYNDLFSVDLKFLVETQGWKQTEEIVKKIKKTYKDCVFHDMMETTARGDKPGPCKAPYPMCHVRDF